MNRRFLALLISSAVVVTSVGGLTALAAGRGKPKKPAPVAKATVEKAKPAKEAKAAKKPALAKDASVKVAAKKPVLRELFRKKKEAAARAAIVGQEGPRGEAEGLKGFDDWFYGQRAYPAQSIPSGAVQKAQKQAVQGNRPRRDENGAPIANAPSAPHWVAIGPSTIPDGQVDDSAGGPLSPVSGRVSAIAAHPTNPNVVYVGGAQGGVWKTTNALAATPTWVPLTDHQPSLAIGDIAIDPVNPNIIYAGTGELNGSCDSYYGQGVLRSTNGGVTWVILGNTGEPFNNPGPFSGKAISRIVIDPGTAGSSTGTTLWATTGSGVTGSGTSACSTPSNATRGLYRSTDSGATWVRQAFPGLGPNDGLLTAEALEIDPTDANVLYVAFRAQGVWKSTDAKAPVPTFVRLSTGLPPVTASPAFRRITLSIGGSGSPGTLYAALASSVGSQLWGVFKTTDAGANWFHVDNGVNGSGNVVQDASPPSSPNSTLTATSGAPFTPLHVGRRIYINNAASRTITAVLNPTTIRITGGGLNLAAVPWSIASYPNYCDGQCFYDMTVAVDPQDANTVYVGGNNRTFNADVSPGPFAAHSNWRSDDGGNTWGSVSQGDGVSGGLHVDDHDYAFFTGVTPSRVYDGNDGGIWRSDDKGSSWAHMNTNLAITQFQSVALHPTNPGIVLGGTQDNGTNILNSALQPPPAWFHTDFGDGGQAAIDQNDPLKMYHTYFNARFNFYGPARSDTGGDNGPGNWTFVGTYFGYGSQYYNGMDPTDPVSFYAPVVVNSAPNPSAVYFGSNRVYRSTDPQYPCDFSTNPCTPVVSWTAVSGNLTRLGGTTPVLSAIGPAPMLVLGNEVAYTGSSDGRVSVSANVVAGPASWAAIDGANAVFPTRFVTEIEVDESDTSGGTAYVAFSGFNGNTPSRPGHLFKITNGLVAPVVTNVSGDLPDVPVTAIALDPTTSPTTLYVGTDIGVFMSVDGGATWLYLNDGHPNVAVFGLDRNRTTGQIVSATHGRGMFRLVSTGLADTAPPVCSGANVSNSLFQGAANDAGVNDSGIASVTLDSAVNTSISTTFVSPQSVTFSVSLVNNCVAGSGTVVVTDYSGLTCSVPVSLPGDQPAAPTAGSNSPVDPGDTINLTSTTAPGATYSWTGPNGFTANVQNPSIPNADASHTGVYTVTVNVNGCTASASTTVVVTDDKGDFNGDGKADILWRDQASTGNIVIWYMNGVTRTGATLTTPSSFPNLNWQIQGTGDFNGDNKPDILWRDQASTGNLAVWYMNGATQTGATLLNPSSFPNLNWRIVGTGDFNGDEKPDLVWRDQGVTGNIVVWYMDGINQTGSASIVPFSNLNWQIQGVGDFNDDGKPDLLWRDQASTGNIAVWYMDGTTRTGTASITPFANLNWQIQGLGDYNNDGQVDLLWRDQASTGNIAVWYMNGATVSGTTLVNPSPFPNLNWRIVGPK